MVNIKKDTTLNNVYVGPGPNNDFGMHSRLEGGPVVSYSEVVNGQPTAGINTRVSFTSTGFGVVDNGGDVKKAN